MRIPVVSAGDTNLRKRATADLFAKHERAHPCQVGLISEGQQVKHETTVLFERARNTNRLVHDRHFAVALLLGLLDTSLRVAHGVEILRKFNLVTRAQGLPKPVRLVGHEVENAAVLTKPGKPCAVLALGISSTTSAQSAIQEPPRTPWGDPDLQGVWDNRTITPLERPQQFAERPSLTAEEAVAYEAATAEQRVNDRYYWDRGTKTVGDRRTSLIIDPVDGRVPPLTPAGQRRMEAGRSQGVNAAEERNPSERCITRTVPRLPGLYNNHYQILQAPGYVVIFSEMIHHARIVPLDGRLHLAENIRQWNGDSRGHWEEETLVIETTNFTSRTNFLGSARNLHLIERLVRVDADTIDYRFTASDATTWSRSWTAQIPFNRNEGRLYEYVTVQGVRRFGRSDATG